MELPGKSIEGARLVEIAEKIEKHINPYNKPYIELVGSWEKVDHEYMNTRLLKNYDEFYMLYEHPVHSFKNRLSLVSKNELIQFLQERINPDRMEGVDITVTNNKLKIFMICNHDGDIYYIDEA